jgi:hypothetical protein
MSQNQNNQNQQGNQQGQQEQGEQKNNKDTKETTIPVDGKDLESQEENTGTEKGSEKMQEGTRQDRADAQLEGNGDKKNSSL